MRFSIILNDILCIMGVCVKCSKLEVKGYNLFVTFLGMGLMSNSLGRLVKMQQRNFGTP